MNILDIVNFIISAILLALVQAKLFLIIQQSGYKVQGVLNWYKTTKYEYFLRYFALSFFSFITAFCFSKCFIKFEIVQSFSLVFYILFAVMFFIFSYVLSHKVKLKMTARMVRLIIVTFALNLALSFGVGKLSLMLNQNNILVTVLPLFSPLIVILAMIIIYPFERMNNLSYQNKAIMAIQEYPSLIKIAITGSYGKTTLKNILNAMLSIKYNVCATPKSFNTPMGISIAVNNSLDENTQIFIAEMGAKNVGDISELCKLVKPNFACLTAIGNQHLASFGSLENIIKTKYEVVENLNETGLAIFNGDNAILSKLFDKCDKNKYIVGAKGIPNARCYYDNVQIDEFGSSFDIFINDKKQHINTSLLGEHIPSLVVMAAALAFDLGISLPEIAQAMSNLEPIPHRLELIKSGDDIILDDAYNANTEGAYNALKVLNKFDKIKVIITPGIVELGKEEKQANMTFGQQIGDVCDYAILVDKLAPIINDGINKSDNKNIKVIIVKTLDEGVEKLKQIQGGKAILFENDLPDIY